MEKVTKKIRFEQLQDLLAAVDEMDVDFEGAFDVKALNKFCEEEIAQLDKKAAKAKERAAKAREGAEGLKDAVAAVLSDSPMTKDEIVAAVQEANPDMEMATSGRIVTRLTMLADEGVIVKESVSVGETGAKRKLMTYRLKVEE